MIDRLWRAFWSVVFYFELRAKGVRSASFVTLRGKRPLIRNEGSMRLGKNFRAHGRVIRSQFATIGSGSLVFGDDVGLNEGVSISAQRSVTIGDNVFIADYVSIHDSDYHEVEPGAGVGTAPVRIERNAWIGRNAVVLRGVTIGQNAVVASGAIVTKDVPAGTVVAGNPARVIRELAISNPDTYVRPR